MNEPALRALKEEKKVCCHLKPRGWGFSSKPCTNKAKVERGGKPYCGLHDPDARKARRDLNTAVFNERLDRKQAQWRIDREANAMLALLIESQTSIGGDWRERRDAIIRRTEGKTTSSETKLSGSPPPTKEGVE